MQQDGFLMAKVLKDDLADFGGIVPDGRVKIPYGVFSLIQACHVSRSLFEPFKAWAASPPRPESCRIATIRATSARSRAILTSRDMPHIRNSLPYLQRNCSIRKVHPDGMRAFEKAQIAICAVKIGDGIAVLFAVCWEQRRNA